MLWKEPTLLIEFPLLHSHVGVAFYKTDKVTDT